VGRAGHPLEEGDAEELRCPETGSRYRVVADRLEEVTT
jgi:hypothetical protein